MSDEGRLSDETIKEIERRVSAASPGPGVPFAGPGIGG